MQERLDYESQEGPQVTFEEMADEVRQSLGPELTSFIAFHDVELPDEEQEDLKPEKLSYLIRRELEPTAEVVRRIKNTFAVINTLLDAGEDCYIIQSWFKRQNPDLDDLSPKRAIAINPQQVKWAANTFVVAEES